MLKTGVSKAAENYHFQGVAGMIPTARVQRGLSQAARCASTGISPAIPNSFFSILLEGKGQLKRLQGTLR
jgi:hypothetical protein